MNVIEKTHENRKVKNIILRYLFINKKIKIIIYLNKKK
jgi:hypothetical protein